MQRDMAGGYATDDDNGGHGSRGWSSARERGGKYTGDCPACVGVDLIRARATGLVAVEHIMRCIRSGRELLTGAFSAGFAFWRWKRMRYWAGPGELRPKTTT